MQTSVRISQIELQYKNQGFYYPKNPSKQFICSLLSEQKQLMLAKEVIRTENLRRTCVDFSDTWIFDSLVQASQSLRRFLPDERWGGSGLYCRQILDTFTGGQLEQSLDLLQQRCEEANIRSRYLIQEEQQLKLLINFSSTPGQQYGTSNIAILDLYNHFRLK